MSEVVIICSCFVHVNDAILYIHAMSVRKSFSSDILFLSLRIIEIVDL